MRPEDLERIEKAAQKRRKALDVPVAQLKHPHNKSPGGWPAPLSMQGHQIVKSRSTYTNVVSLVLVLLLREVPPPSFSPFAFQEKGGPAKSSFMLMPQA